MQCPEGRGAILSLNHGAHVGSFRGFSQREITQLSSTEPVVVSAEQPGGAEEPGGARGGPGPPSRAREPAMEGLAPLLTRAGLQACLRAGAAAPRAGGPLLVSGPGRRGVPSPRGSELGERGDRRGRG